MMDKQTLQEIYDVLENRRKRLEIKRGNAAFDNLSPTTADTYDHYQFECEAIMEIIKHYMNYEQITYTETPRLG